MDYFKKERGRELYPRKRKDDATVDLTTEGTEVRSDMPPSMSKQEPILDTARYFLVLEGEEKEPDYLKVLVRGKAFRNLKIAYKSLSNKKGDGNLIHKIVVFVKNAIQNKEIEDKTGVKYSLNEIDKIYAVVDVDSLENEIATGVKQLSEAQWIISNPCFEIWLYYAFHNTPEEDFKLDEIDVSQRSQTLKTMLNQVHKGGIGGAQAFAEIHTAIVNAKQHYLLDRNGVPVLYATQMFIFAEQVLMTLKDSYDQWIARKIAMAAFYREGEKSE